MTHSTRVQEILSQVRRLAAEYYYLTGKPLGCTGEIGECLAAEVLGLTLVPARTAGFDATRNVCSQVQRIQIKTRAYPSGADKGQRMPKVTAKAPFDVVMLVILDEKTLDLCEIWEAPNSDYRARVALLSPNEQERGMKVLAFKSFAQKIF